jgi:hypothetical protein
MLKITRKLLFVAAFLVSLTLSDRAAHAAINDASDVQVMPTPTGVTVIVTNDDANGYIVPDVSVLLPGVTGQLTYTGKVGCEDNPNLPCGTYHDYWNYTFGGMPACSTAVAEVMDGNVVSGAFSSPCSVRGVAFEDLNANGKRDAGEPIFGGAWLKVTNGGNWFVCGSVGDDATFAVVVNPGIYYVMPVNLQGYRVTTPRLKAIVNANAASLGHDIGYVKDASAQLEGCDLYHPARP